MKSILLIKPDADLRDIYKKNIVKNFEGYSVTECVDVQAAIKALIINPNYELICVRDAYKGVNNVGVLISFLKKSKIDSPLVIFGENSFSYENEILIDPNLSWRKKLKEIASILNIILTEDQELNLTDFVNVPIVYFINLSKYLNGCDVYKTFPKNTDKKYIKSFAYKDEVDKDEIVYLQKLGYNWLYIIEDYVDDFYELALREISRKFQKAKIPPEELLQLASDAYDIVRDRIHRFKLDESTLTLIGLSFNAIKSFSEKENSLSNFLHRKYTLNLSYGFLRVYFLAVLAPHVLPKLGFLSENSLDKIQYINYFHDISIYNDTFLKIHNEHDLVNSNLAKSEIEFIQHHAFKSSEIVSQMSNIPSGVSDIILEHHGARNGLGFKDNQSISLAVLSMIFLVMEDIVFEILKRQDSLNSSELEDLFHTKAMQFNKINYKETLEALREVIRL